MADEDNAVPRTARCLAPAALRLLIPSRAGLDRERMAATK
jgi:hypothetical protein